jgi:DNA mismatch repair protein MutS2
MTLDMDFGAAVLLSAKSLSDAWTFAQVEEFWKFYDPFTPYGKDERDERRVYADRSAIEALLDRTDRALAWLDRVKDDPAAQDRAGYCLKRMPRLPGMVKDSYELSEIFQVKKFLSNYSGLRKALDGETRAAFSLEPVAEALISELSKGGSDPESFFVADAYDPELAAVRRAIAKVDADLEAARSAAETRLASKHNVRLSGRDFALVPRAAAQGLFADRELAIVEPYDDRLYLVRLASDADTLALRGRRDDLASQERDLEEKVLVRLSGGIAGVLPGILAASERAKDFDLALARARLVREYSLVRPDLSTDVLEVFEGRFLPCQAECEALGLSYTPLAARFEKPVTTIFGSNMGGKTIALKTVLFFQILSQAGFHVPAASFRSRVYARLAYVGELTGERLAGLSGFGFEIHRFIQAWEGMGDGCLVVFDEFARTTSSREAEAIISAAQEELAGKPGVKSFFATHFRDIRRSEGVAYLRMKGLEKKAVLESLESGAPLAERLERINRNMRYELEPDDDGEGSSDALTVAALLGLPERIVARAERIIRDR